uniref:G-protein coupled receptors family 1 profile domain-containing protein n=1 Tax=Myripristis murdjan TaxID=586833 RepID=A0A667YMH1_9TELE
MNSTPVFPTSPTYQPLDNTTTAASPTLIAVIIAANDFISRANYAYSFFAALGFLSACFLLYSFVLTYRAQRRLVWLDCLLWLFCGLQLLLLLLSLYAVAHRPNDLVTTRVGCAALSFTINTASTCSLLLLALMAYVLTFNPASHTLPRRLWVCVALVVSASVSISLLLAGLRGPSDHLGVKENCFMDRVQAGISYAATKFFLAFLTPYVLQLGLVIGGCVRKWRSTGRFLSGSEEGSMFSTVTVIVFFCQLFYGVVLLRGVRLEERGAMSHHERAFLCVAEFVLFSASCASLLLMLLMHRPHRENLRELFSRLRDWCRNPGRAQTNRIKY